MAFPVTTPIRTVLDLAPVIGPSQLERLTARLARERLLDLDELDFYWRGERLAVEIDGFRHHSSRPRFEGDRRKDTWLRARGLSVIRLSWRQITQEATATAVQLGQALMHAVR